jgi:hypothetical protein
MKKGKILIILSVALGFFIACSLPCYAFNTTDETFALGGPSNCEMVVTINNNTKSIVSVAINPSIPICGDLEIGTIDQNYLCDWVSNAATNCKVLNFVSERVLVTAGRTYYLYDGGTVRWKFAPNFAP